MARYSKTLTPAAEAAFLAALRSGALVVAAARAAGVAVSTLYCRRARDEAFADDWEMAVDASRGAPGRRAPFDRARRRGFLGAFEASCNTLASCAETAVHPATVYRHIGSDPGFEQDCRAALALGTTRLERELAAGREARAARWAAYEIEPTGTMTQDFDEQMRLLARWERTDGSIGPRRVRHGRMKRWTFDKAMKLLAKRLRGMEPRWAGGTDRRARRDKGAASG